MEQEVATSTEATSTLVTEAPSTEAPSTEATSTEVKRSNKDLLTEFYAKYDEAKVGKVDAILGGWPLAELMEALKGKYGECPDLVADPVPPAEQTDDKDAGVISSEDSDLVVVSANIVKKVKKKKKDKKEKKNGKTKDGAQPVAPATAQPGKQVPQNWGRGKKNWWTEAMKEVNAVKRRLTRKAMSFVDEAVRLSREEKQRQAAERREARLCGLKEEVQMIEDDVVPEPEEEVPEDAYMESDARHGELSENYEFRPAESGGEEDDDGGHSKKRKMPAPVSRKKTHKEEMAEALENHFKTIEGEEETPAPDTFKEYDAFNAQKAHDQAHGIAEGDPDDSGSCSDDSSDEDVQKKDRRPLDYWGKPPEELLARTDLEESVNGSRAYVAHFVRFVMGMWQSYVSAGHKIEGNGLTQGAAESFNSEMVLDKTREALTPLLERLQKNTISPDNLRQVDTIATLAAARNYKTCMEEYVMSTMGRKTWHMTHMQTMMQQNHGGSVAKILKQSDFVSFDYDPTVNAYSLALKRAIQFLQWLRPPAEHSMGSYM